MHGAGAEERHETDGNGAGPGCGVVRKLNCQEVLDQLSVFLEEELAAELRAEIETHLNGCRHCHLEVDTIRTTIQLYRVDDPVGVPIHLSDRIRAALASAYRERDRLTSD